VNLGPPTPETATAAGLSVLGSFATLGVDPLTLCCAAAGVFIVSANLPPSSTKLAALGRLLATIFLSAVFAAVVEQRVGGGNIVRAGSAGVIGLGFHTVLATAIKITPDTMAGIMQRLFNVRPTDKKE
jgi:hypothetical protein